MKIKNRKGMSLEVYFLITAFFLGLGFWAANYFGEHKVIKNYIGQYQFSIMKTANKAESALFYIEQSAKYALQQSVYELAQNGGFSEAASDEGVSFNTNECGKFSNFNIWYQLKKDKQGNIIKASCFDERLLPDSLEYTFDENLNKYLTNYPYDIQTDNYDYEIKNSLEITGTAKEPLIFYILKDEGKPAVKKPKPIKLPEEVKPSEEKKPPEEKPNETKTIPMVRDFEDFTGTDLCAKGTKCLLTKEAYELLNESQQIAKQKGVSLEVTSAYRSMARQIEIWEVNKDKYPDPKVRRKYIANPYECNGVCPHGTGNVVDIKLKGKIFGAMSSGDWKLLEQVMSQAGWVRYAAESWHFECCGTGRYKRAQEIAKRTGKEVTAIV